MTDYRKYTDYIIEQAEKAPAKKAPAKKTTAAKKTTTAKK